MLAATSTPGLASKRQEASSGLPSHVSLHNISHNFQHPPLSLPREAMVQLEPPVVWTHHTPAGCHFHSRTCCTSGSSLPTCPRTYFILPLASHIRGFPICPGESHDISLVGVAIFNFNLLSQDSIHISKAQDDISTL